MEKVAAKPIDPKVLDELVAGVQSNEDFKELLKQLNKGSLERVLETEMTHHLGHESGGEVTMPRVILVTARVRKKSRVIWTSRVGDS